MALYRIRWRQEGETVMYGKTEDDAKDKLCEALNTATLPNFHPQQTESEDAELLACELVAWQV